MTTRRPTIWTSVAVAALALGLALPAVAGPPAGKGKNKPSLTISLASSSIEENDTTAGTVTFNNAGAGTSIVVTLGSTDGSIATVVPVTEPVILSDGEPSADFVIAGQPGDGDRSVTITADSDTGLSADAELTVTDPSTTPQMGRYEIVYPALPPDVTGGVWINDVNNRGQVVGWYLAENTRRAFIYDPSVDSAGIIDLNAIPVGGGVTGYHLGSAVGINEHQVIVGYLLNEANNRIAFALDLSAEFPVADLLPNLGSDFSYGMKINENGDVLGLFEDVDGVQVGYLYNPGYYGVPSSRNPRDGSPLDLSTDLPDILPVTGRAGQLALNNPVAGRPAQVGGTDANGIAFRYTTGDEPVYEDFPDLDLTWNSLFFGINDSGVFIGNATYIPEGAKGKGKWQTQPFRYGSTVEWLPMDRTETPQDINDSNDLISYTHVYRDGWGWVSIDQLVEGSEPDLADWLLGTPDLFEMSDRVFPNDVGYIAGRLGNVDEFPRLFVLIPLPAP